MARSVPSPPYIHVVVALEVHPDLHWPVVVMLAQLDDLLDNVGMSDRRTQQRRTRPILESIEAFVLVPALPPVKDIAADAVVAASSRHVPADLFSVLYYRQAPVRPSDQILLTLNTVSHAAPSIRSSDCQQPQSVLDHSPVVTAHRPGISISGSFTATAP